MTPIEIKYDGDLASVGVEESPAPPERTSEGGLREIDGFVFYHPAVPADISEHFYPARSRVSRRRDYGGVHSGSVPAASDYSEFHSAVSFRDFCFLPAFPAFRCSQISLSAAGQRSHPGFFAEHTSRPKSTSRWQVSV